MTKNKTKIISKTPPKQLYRIKTWHWVVGIPLLALTGPVGFVIGVILFICTRALASGKDTE